MSAAGNKDDLRIRMLIVDDEQTIRKLCVTVGEALGFVCLEAESGESALALLEEQPAHMVLTDMVMPGMNGRELADTVLASQPDLKVIYMSGYTDDMLLHTGALGSGMAVLRKPLRPDVLAGRIREVLDSGGVRAGNAESSAE